MSSEWDSLTIGDLVKNGEATIQTGPFGSQLHSYDYVAAGTPVIPTEAIGRGRILNIAVPQVDSSKAIELSRHRLRIGDILFARRGAQATGLSAIVDERFEGALCGTGALLLRIHSSRVDARYLAMFLSSDAAYTWLRAHAVGAVMPNLNTEIIKALPIALPDIEQQKSIASFFNSLDDRITLLRETNVTLEAIAQALFKSWFVNFGPVRAKQEGRVPEGMDEATAALFPDGFEESELGVVPRGWRASTMGDVTTVGIGKTPPRKEQHWFSRSPGDVRWVSIRDLGEGGVFLSQTNEFLTNESIKRFNVRTVPDRTVLLSFKMTIGRVAITDGEMVTNEAIAHFKLNEDSSLTSEYIYLYLKQFNFSGLSSTSSIADAVNSKTVRSIPIHVPSRAILEAFQVRVQPIFARIKNMERQSQILAAIRDTLLPRMLSGQLRLRSTAD